MSWTRRIAASIAIAVVALTIAVVVAGLLVSRTNRFREWIRAGIVERVERETGSAAALDSVDIQVFPISIELRGFSLQGTGPADEPPLFRASLIQAGVGLDWRARGRFVLRSVLVERPEFRLVFYPDGTNNLPRPRRTGEDGPVAAFVDLAIRQFELREGIFQVGERRFDVSVRGDELDGQLFYDFGGPRYVGNLVVRRFSLDAPGEAGELVFNFESSVEVRRARIEVLTARLQRNESTIQASGIVDELENPRVALGFYGSVFLEDVAGPLRLPLERTGSAVLTGILSAGGGQPFVIEGQTTARGIVYRHENFSVQNVRASSNFRVDETGLALDRTRASTLDGAFAGAARFREFRHFSVSGNLSGISLRQALQTQPWGKEMDYAGTVSGQAEAAFEYREGAPRNLRASGSIQVEPRENEGIPLTAGIHFRFAGDTRQIAFERSFARTPSAAVEFDGILNEGLRVGVRTSDLQALLAEAPRIEGLPREIPLRLVNGEARFNGLIRGDLDNPAIEGRIAMDRFQVQGVDATRFEADFSANRSLLTVRRAALSRDGLDAKGSGGVRLSNWRIEDQSVLQARLEVAGADMKLLLKEAGHDLPIDAVAALSAEVSGTAVRPAGSLRFETPQAAVYGEVLRNVQGRAVLDGQTVRLEEVLARAAGGAVQLSGAFEREGTAWGRGRLRLQGTASGLGLSRIRRVEALAASPKALLQARFEAVARVDGREFRLEDLNGRASVQDLALDGTPLGSALFVASSERGSLVLTMDAVLAGTNVQGLSEWKLTGNYPGTGAIRIGRLEFAALRPWLLREGEQELPATGFVAGDLNFSGEVLQPESWRGQLELSEVSIMPRALGGDARADLLEVRNQGPIRVQLDGEQLELQQARFTGQSTNLELSGRIALRAQQRLDLQARGTVDLELLPLFERNIRSSGVSQLDATIRGTPTQPEVSGRVELKNASLYYGTLPNGLDQANGLVLFDGRRATIDRLTAVSGGGTVSAGGFVQFAGPETSYRFQLKADGVRVRYPEGVSSAANAEITLAGTPSSSVLTGDVTVLRIGFTPRLDVGGMLAAAGRPTPTPTTSEYLRGLQFNVRLVTAPDVRIETALTRDIEAEADLRLRGSIANPILLGRFTVSQGEINFFDNRYTINRGEISFVNPVRIEPVVNLDLQTRTRAIDVNLTFTGPINRLNVNYRSDPPLQLAEILALLATGRQPAFDPTLAAQQARVSQNWQQIGANTLLSQALARPVAGRLQRFFGISRLRIDPQLAGIDQEAQARITLEQQISRDVTFVYTTNLVRAQHQSVRLEWDLSRQLQMIVGRDENGFVGADFLFRKRF